MQKTALILLSIVLLLFIFNNLRLGARVKRLEPYLIVLKKGQPVVSSLLEILKKQGISSCSLSGLGAVENPTIAYYNLEEKQYIPHTFEGIFEVASLNGNVSKIDDSLALHIHLVLGNDHYETIAGHLNEAIVGGTLEITVIPFSKDYKRQHDPETGLNQLLALRKKGE